MTGLIEYVKSFLALFMLIKVLLHLVPKSVFSRYIAFFSGVILAIGMLYPVMQLLGMEEKVLEGMQYETFEEELYEISQDATQLEHRTLERYEKLLEEMETEMDE